MSQNEFYFSGPGPFSKSLLIRALLVKSFFPDFAIQGESLCGDVTSAQKAVQNLQEGKREFHFGLSAGVLRFFALRVAREKGRFLFRADPALWRRPLEGLFLLLSQLSVKAERKGESLIISSEGWKIQGDGLYIPSQISSQYASALVLSSWNLSQDLYFSLEGDPVSYSYFQMSLDFAKSLGLVVKGGQKEFCIPKGQKASVKLYRPERDKSCLFALSAFAALKGRAVFTDWKEESLQPDQVFPKLLSEMGVFVERGQGRLVISPGPRLKPLKRCLKNTPDLFPLLAVLCSQAEGASELKGLSHLKFKESDRLEKTRELLQKSGGKMTVQNGKAIIQGGGLLPGKAAPFVFDADNDHRMVMASELTRRLGAPVSIRGKRFVNKSFPAFYSLIDTGPVLKPAQSYKNRSKEKVGKNI